MAACNSTTNLKSLPSIQDLNTWFDYNPDTGSLTWRVKLSNRGGAVGSEVGSKDDIGYKRVCVRRRRVYVHRIVWAMVTGSWPEKQIDHINGNRDDNRFENLRDVSPSENLRNCKLRRNNTTGVNGVIKQSYLYSKPYAAYGNDINKTPVCIGRFDTLEEAAQARAEFDKLHGYHENHGRRQ